jgi:hypothetical protein
VYLQNDHNKQVKKNYHNPNSSSKTHQKRIFSYTVRTPYNNNRCTYADMSQFCHYIKFAKVASSAAYLHKPAHRTKEPKAVEIFCLHVWVCFHSHTTSNWKPWPLPEKCLSSKGRGSALRERGKAAPASLYCHGLAAFTSRGEQPSKARKAVLKTPGTPFWEPTYLYYTTTVPQFIKNIFPVFFKVASCNVRFLVFFTHTGSLGTVVWHQDMIFFFLIGKT